MDLSQAIQSVLIKIRDEATEGLKAEGSPDKILQRYKKALAFIVFKAADARREELATWINVVDDHVQRGPFAGMKALRDNKSWDYLVKILGFYEEELHKYISLVIEKNYPVVINVGSAEGYYAVGLARHMVNSRIIAFELDPNSQTRMAEVAQINGVEKRVEIRGRCTLENLGTILQEEEARWPAPFLLMDCEGAELELLDPITLPELRRCDFIVECHDMLDRTITPTLMSRFQESHHLTLVRQGARDPGAVPILRGISDLDRWLLVDEGRPEIMHWLIATANKSGPEKKNRELSLNRQIKQQEIYIAI